MTDPQKYADAVKAKLPHQDRVESTTARLGRRLKIGDPFEAAPRPGESLAEWFLGRRSRMIARRSS